MLRFALGVLVASSIVIASYLVWGHRGPAETFGIALVAFGTAGGVTAVLHRHRTGGIVLGLAIAVAVLAVAVVVRPGRGGPIAYVEVDALMADADTYLGQPVKLHGYIELGSIQARVVDGRSSRTFGIHGAKHSPHRVAATFDGPVPDTFADRAEVVATGTLAHDGDAYRFHATEVSAKCPDTYQTDSGPQPAAKFR